MSDLEGRSALVTGGSRGIGQAVAERLAADGARVVVTGRSRERLEAVAEQIGGHAVVLDLGVRSGLDAGVARIRELVGPVDVLVNNAGVAPGAPLSRTTDELWDEVLQVNTWATMALCRAFVPAMAEAGWGRVINVASIAGLAGQAYTSAYCASKHAVVGLTRALAMEFARTGVTVNAVCPGWVETDMARAAVERISESTGRDAQVARAALERQSPQQRMVQPEEVAALVATLASEESRGIHGQALAIDGGTLMR